MVMRLRSAWQARTQMQLYVTSAQGCLKTLNAKDWSRFIFRTHLATEKILFLECAVLWAKSPTGTQRFVKRLGTKLVIEGTER